MPDLANYFGYPPFQQTKVAPVITANKGPGRPHKLTPQQRQDALARLQAGESLEAIARTYGVSRNTIGGLRTLHLIDTTEPATPDPAAAATNADFEKAKRMIAEASGDIEDEDLNDRAEDAVGRASTKGISIEQAVAEELEIANLFASVGEC
jgi:hypothetical protein